MSQGQDPNTEQARTRFVMSVVNVVGGGGFVMLGIVLAALFVGLTADQFLGTRPLFTLGLLVLSAPLSIFLMFRIAMKAISKIQPLAQTRSDRQGEKTP